MAKPSAGAVIRNGLSRSSGLVVLVLVAVMLYYVATHLRDVLKLIPRPALESIARMLGVPEDIIRTASDNTLRELIHGAAKGKLGALAVFATAAAAFLAMWKFRGLLAIAGAGGVGGIAAAVLFYGVALAGLVAVYKVAEKAGVYPVGGGGGGGAIVPGMDGCMWDGKQWRCNLPDGPGVPVTWNTGGSVYA